MCCTNPSTHKYNKGQVSVVGVPDISKPIMDTVFMFQYIMICTECSDTWLQTIVSTFSAVSTHVPLHGAD